MASTRGVPFEEEAWGGGTLAIRDAADAPAFAVTMKDLRCVMVNLDPDSGASSPEILKAIVAATDNYAGVYATPTRAGRIAVGRVLVLQQPD